MKVGESYYSRYALGGDGTIQRLSLVYAYVVDSTLHLVTFTTQHEKLDR